MSRQSNTRRHMAGPKETAYNEHISPLMTQIIALCQEHKINAFATFALDVSDENGLMRCTTSLPVDKADEEGHTLVCRLHDIVRPRHHFMAMTIVGKRGDA